MRLWLIVFLMAAVPLAFNTDTFDVFNLTKFTLVTLATIVIAGLWILEMVQRKKLLYPRTGIELPMLALLAASAVATATTFSRVVSILGFYKSYDGLISIAVFTVLGLATAEVFDDKRQVRAALYSLVLGGGLLSAVYGVLQYVTFTTEGRLKLDWELWGPASFKTSAIFSTYGNPNHFAGFLAICIPVALVLLASTSEPTLRWALGAFAALAFLEIIQTQTRGAWAAIAITAVALNVLFLPDIRKRPLPFAAAGASAVAMFLFAAVALRSRTNLFVRLASMFQAADTSSRQRVLLWEAGIKAGMDRFFTGWGLDTFRVVFLRYQGMEFFKRYGPTQIANGPHNVFISWFYSAGILGIGAFLWLIAAVFVPAVRMAAACLRGERRVQERFKKGIPVVRELREWRLLIGGTAIAVLSFLVSESFNVNQIGITFLLYTIAPLSAKLSLLSREALADAARSARIAEDEMVRPPLLAAARSRLALPSPKEGAASSAARATADRESARVIDKRNKKSTDRIASGRGSSGAESRRAIRSKSGNRSRNSGAIRGGGSRRGASEKLRVATAVVAVIYVSVSVPLGWLAARPYRADHVYRQFMPVQELVKSAFQELIQQDPEFKQPEGAGMRAALEDYLATARQRIDEAIRRNPWESRYFFDKYEVSRIEAWLAGSGEAQREALERADAALLEAIRLSPQEERFHKTRGELMNYWGGARGEGRLERPDPVDPSKLQIAVESLLEARRYNPYNLDIDYELMLTAQALQDRNLIYDAGCHGFELGEGKGTVLMATTMANDGYLSEAIDLLRYYLRRFDYHSSVAQALGDITATAVPSDDGGLRSPITEPTVPLGPCVVDLLRESRP